MNEFFALMLLWSVPGLVVFGSLVRSLGWPFHEYRMYSSYLKIDQVRVYSLKYRTRNHNEFQFWEPAHFKEKMFCHAKIQRLVTAGASNTELVKVVLQISLSAEMNGEMSDVEELQLVERSICAKESQWTAKDVVLCQFNV